MPELTGYCITDKVRSFVVLLDVHNFDMEWDFQTFAYKSLFEDRSTKWTPCIYTLLCFIERDFVNMSYRTSYPTPTKLGQKLVSPISQNPPFFKLAAIY